MGQLLPGSSKFFKFIIEVGNNPRTDYGDGMTFFMAPFELEQPKNAYGGGLGLFNDTTLNGSFYQMVAVEFDTFKNAWDPFGDHVGIDVNSIESKASVSLINLNKIYSLCNTSLKNGKEWHAWVDYE